MDMPKFVFWRQFCCIASECRIRFFCKLMFRRINHARSKIIRQKSSGRQHGGVTRSIGRVCV